MKMRETTKEALLGFWQDIEKRTGVRIGYDERTKDIVRTEKGFAVRTTKGSYETRAVLPAIGRRAAQARSASRGAAEGRLQPDRSRAVPCSSWAAATRLSRPRSRWPKQPGTTVALSYRGDALDRAKPRTRERLLDMTKAGRLKLMTKPKVRALAADCVQLDHEGKAVDLENDAVIVCASGVLPTPFLKKIGIIVETKCGAA